MVKRVGTAKVVFVLYRPVPIHPRVMGLTQVDPRVMGLTPIDVRVLFHQNNATWPACVYEWRFIHNTLYRVPVGVSIDVIHNTQIGSLAQCLV